MKTVAPLLSERLHIRVHPHITKFKEKTQINCLVFTPFGVQSIMIRFGFLLSCLIPAVIDMPQISEMSSSMVPVGESPESSLQVSSTASPEQDVRGGQSKALRVKKTDMKPASRSSSSSSRASLPPSGLSRVPSGGALSHRGRGSIPMNVTHMSRADIQMDADVYQDQRSTYQEQHLYDQRTQEFHVQYICRLVFILFNTFGLCQ